MVSKVAKSKLERGIQDGFARFAETPSRETFREFLTSHTGESRSVDFKQEWLPSPELAKKILGFANTGPACLVFGVAERADKSLEPVGLSAMEDKADIQNKLRKFLPSSLMEQLATHDFVFESSEYEKIKGKKFQVLLIDYNPEYIPYVAVKNSTDLRDTAIYVRRDGQTVEANYDELQKVLNSRIATRHSTKEELDLKQHLEQLKALYSELPRSSLFVPSASAIFGRTQVHEGVSYGEFVEELIADKKRVLKNTIGMKGLNIADFMKLHKLK